MSNGYDILQKLAADPGATSIEGSFLKRSFLETEISYILNRLKSGSFDLDDINNLHPDSIAFLEEVICNVAIHKQSEILNAVNDLAGYAGDIDPSDAFADSELDKDELKVLYP